MSVPNCKPIREAIANRQFLGWGGLPESCRAGELFSNLPESLEGWPTRGLGDDFEPAVFVVLEMPGYYRPTANFRDGKLIMFDATTPELPNGFDPLHQDLGEPALHLDWDYGTLPIPQGEWVYAECGITVFVNTKAEKLLHIALYHVTTPDEYVRRLRPHLKKTLRPMKT